MRIIDNVIALRILWLLVTPFEKTEAFKLGLIDKEGTFLRKAKTQQEINSSSMLHRLVWRIKKFINLVPGGSTRIGSIVAAYALVRECIDKNEYDRDSFVLLESAENHIPDAEYELVKEFLELFEDAPANITGPGTSTDQPAISKRKKAVFNVKRETFDKFKNGKTKFRRWGHYLNLDDDNDKEIYHYAKKHPKGILILQDEEGRSKGIRYSKHGGGNWHNIKRKPKQVLESFIEDFNLEVIVLC